MATWTPYTSTGSTYSSLVYFTTATTTSTSATVDYDDYYKRPSPPLLQTHLVKGQKVELPDGSRLIIDNKGNFEIKDEDCKVRYLGNRIREFNKFINASDLLEQFIRDLGEAGIKQGEVLGVPVELFINWLIHKAAEQDGDIIPATIPKLPQLTWKHNHPKCKYCGRFVKTLLHKQGMNFCNGEHYQKHLEGNVKHLIGKN